VRGGAPSAFLSCDSWHCVNARALFDFWRTVCRPTGSADDTGAALQTGAASAETLRQAESARRGNELCALAGTARPPPPPPRRIVQRARVAVVRAAPWPCRLLLSAERFFPNKRAFAFFFPCCSVHIQDSIYVRCFVPMSQSHTSRPSVSAIRDVANHAQVPVRQTLGSCSQANDKQRTLDLATGLPLINLRYNSKAHRKDGSSAPSSWLEASSRLSGFSSLDALAALTSQYIAAYCQQQRQLYTLYDPDCQQHQFPLFYSTGVGDRSRSDGEEASAESCDETQHNLAPYGWMSARTGRQYIKCYLQVRKTHQVSLSGGVELPDQSIWFACVGVG